MKLKWSGNFHEREQAAKSGGSRSRQKYPITTLDYFQADLENHSNELKMAEDNAKKAMADTTRLAEELRHEQEHSSSIEKLRRTLESQVKELQVTWSTLPDADNVDDVVLICDWQFVRSVQFSSYIYIAPL